MSAPDAETPEEETIFQHFSRAAVASFTGTALSLVGGFAALFVANRLLGKEVFASYAFLTTLVFFAALIASAGLDRLLVYTVSRNHGRWVGSERHDLLAPVFALVTLFGTGGMLLMVFADDTLERLTALPQLALMAPAIGTLALSLPLLWCLIELARSEGRFGHAYVLPALAEPLRAGGLALCLLLSWGSFGASVVTALATALPVALLFGLQRPPVRRMPRRLTPEMWRYALKSLGTRLLKEASLRMNLILLGVLSTAAATADFAVTSRIAMALLVTQTVITSALGPRMARLHADGRADRLNQEFTVTRAFSMALASLGAAVLCVAGAWLLGLFGSYAQALPLMLVLTAAMLVEIAFGPVLLGLIMAGFAGTTLALRGAGVALLLVLSALLIPPYGAMGAAFALLIITALTAVAGGLLARARMQLLVFAPAMLVPAAFAVLALIAAAMLPALTLPAALCLVGVAAFSALDALRHRA